MIVTHSYILLIYFYPLLEIYISLRAIAVAPGVQQLTVMNKKVERSNLSTPCSICLTTPACSWLRYSLSPSFPIECGQYYFFFSDSLFLSLIALERVVIGWFVVVVCCQRLLLAQKKGKNPLAAAQQAILQQAAAGRIPTNKLGDVIPKDPTQSDEV